jgi:glycosyltransferase involved in cell wall biosynthesis
VVRGNGGSPIVLEDKIPRLPDVKPVTLLGTHKVVCVSTYAKDEPIGEVIEAARSLGRSCYVYITGDHRKLRRKALRNLPENLRLTGFLSDEAYISLLRGSDVVMDLTTLDDCLVCGAYEAVAVGKPIIVSDTAAARQYLYKGTVFTRNQSDAISKAIGEAIANLPRLRVEIRALRDELEARWVTRAWHLVERMRGMVEINIPAGSRGR